jgi:hypothetical protein
MDGGQTGGGKPNASDWRQTVTTLVGIVSVLLVAAGLFYTNAANRTQQQLTEQGQVTDRFGRAIDQLGSDKLDVRLGGIYALERLMKDSRPDEPNILEVLSAYIRDHTRTSKGAGENPRHQASDHALPTDIQAALEVLGRRPDPAHHHGINLSEVDISGVGLNGEDFSGAFFSLADLHLAFITDTNFTGASLIGADLTGATLQGSDLTGADLLNTDFTGADLIDVKWPSDTPPPQGWERDPDSGLLHQASAAASSGP